MEYRHITNKIDNLDDLKVWVVGHKAIQPHTTLGPAIRDHYLLHYVRSGQGTFVNNGQTFHLHAGQGFLISPEVIHSYAPSNEDPWTYSWVGFQGTRAAAYLALTGLNHDSPVFTPGHRDTISACYDRMLDSRRTSPPGPIRELKQLAGLYDLLSCLAIPDADSLSTPVNTPNGKQLYIKSVTDYIYKHYPHKVSITEMADEIGLNPSYLGTLFKRELGISPQQFLLQVRMDKACLFMNHSGLTISDIARSVGYEDPLQFSRMFRKIKGMSPAMYRSAQVSQLQGD